MSGTGGKTPTVTFSVSGKSVPWDGSHETLLDLAEAHGLTPDFSCRQGICSTCKRALLAGEVEYVRELLEEPGPGEVLICSARPNGDVTIDV